MVLPSLKTVFLATSPNMVTSTLIQKVSRSKAAAKETGMTALRNPTCAQTDCNRGREGDEGQDYGYNFTNSRRRSNSSTQALGDFKTKFEAIDADPVFEEELHGPTDDDIEKASTLSKEESTDTSTLGGSVDDDDKKM